jgi:hypothetical protein
MQTRKSDSDGQVCTVHGLCAEQLFPCKIWEACNLRVTGKQGHCDQLKIQNRRTSENSHCLMTNPTDFRKQNADPQSPSSAPRKMGSKAQFVWLGLQATVGPAFVIPQFTQLRCALLDRLIIHIPIISF